jgi:8-oxoguanine deaminase
MTEPGAPLLVRGALQLWTGAAGAAMRAAGGTDLRIRDGVVTAMGTLEPEPGERVIDASGCVVYPGWVNTHHHLFQSLLKGIPAGIDLPLVAWLAAVPVRYRRFFDHEQALRVAVRVGLVELMLSGCTTVCDHQYHLYPDMPFDASAAVFDEAERLGLRLVLARGGQTVARAMTDTQAPPQVMPVTVEQFLVSVEDDVRRFHDPSPRRCAASPAPSRRRTGAAAPRSCG